MRIRCARQKLNSVALVSFCKPPEHDHLVVARKTQMARVNSAVPILMKMGECGWWGDVQVRTHERPAIGIDLEKQKTLDRSTLPDQKKHLDWPLV